MKARSLNTLLILIILILIFFHFYKLDGIKKESFLEGFTAASEKCSYQLINEYDRGLSIGKEETKERMLKEFELSNELLKQNHLNELKLEQLKHHYQLIEKDEKHQSKIDSICNYFNEIIKDTIQIITEIYTNKNSNLSSTRFKKSINNSKKKNGKTTKASYNLNSYQPEIHNSINIFLGLTGMVFISLIVQGFFSKHGRLKWR